MSHLPFTILAYLLNSISVTTNKFLLIKSIPNPFVYIFYFSAASLIALLVIPFTKFPPLFVLTLASISTLLWTTGAYFMFKALMRGQVSRVIPIIGTFIPLILLVHAFLNRSITSNEVWAVLLLVLGLIFLTLNDLKGKAYIKEIIYEFLAALLFATSYILLREAYVRWDFLSVLSYSRLILIPVGIVLLLIPKIRSEIFAPNGVPFKITSKTGLLFFGGQIAGGVSEVLLLFSVALANPAIVNSLQGTQYVFLLIFSLVLSKKYPEVFKENFTKATVLLKLVGIILLGLGLYVLAFTNHDYRFEEIGATYSPKYAKELGLDPKITYLKVLDELGVKAIRLPVYWNEVEKSPNEFDFSDVDYYLMEAQKRDVAVILSLGYKQPRWPECYAPTWIESLPKQEKNQRIIELVKKEVEYFKKYPNIILWQVENEPLFYFGECNKPDEDSYSVLEEEVKVVKEADNRPVMLTNTGELSNWIVEMKLGDQFGTTLYRTVWSPQFGIVDYPTPPFFYQIKDSLSGVVVGGNKKPTIIAELQAEPWMPDGKSAIEVEASEQARLMPVGKLEDHISYAKETGFKKAYLWGVEWWYFMEKNGYPEYVEYGKELFK